MADTNLYGLTGAGFAEDSGGRHIDGRRVLDLYDPVQTATYQGSGLFDDAGPSWGSGPAPQHFNGAIGGVFDEQFADAQGFGDLWRSGYKPQIKGQLFDDADVQQESYSPELLEKLGQYQVAKLGFGDDLRQFAIVDKSTGKVVGATAPKAYSGFKDFAKMAIPMVLSIAVPGLGAAVGNALGASGAAATALGNSIVQAGLATVTGADPLKAAIGGGLGSLAGGLASEAVGGGTLGRVAGQVASGTVGGAVRTGSLSGALQNSVRGLLSPGSLLGLGGSALGLDGNGMRNSYGPDAASMDSLVPGFFDEGGEGYAAPNEGGGSMFDWMDDPGVTWDTSGPADNSWLDGANWGGDYSNEGRSYDQYNAAGEYDPGSQLNSGDFWGAATSGSPLGTLSSVLKGLLGSGSGGAGGAGGGGSLATLIASLIGQQAASGQSRDALALQREALNAQKDIAGRQLKLAEDQWNRYLNTYGPLEDEFVQQSRDYGSQANRERAATGAGATVASNYANLRERLSEAPGMDPSSQTYLNTLRKLGVEEAAQKSAAETGARDQVDAQGFARMGDAVSLGKGLPANASAALRGAGATYSGINDAGVLAGQQAANRARSVGGMWGDVLTNPTVQSGIDKAIDWAGGLFGDDK